MIYFLEEFQTASTRISIRGFFIWFPFSSPFRPFLYFGTYLIPFFTSFRLSLSCLLQSHYIPFLSLSLSLSAINRAFRLVLKFAVRDQLDYDHETFMHVKDLQLYLGMDIHSEK